MRQYLARLSGWAPFGLTSFLMIYVAWARGGTRSELYVPIWIISVIFVLLMFLRGVSGDRAAISHMVRDPIFYLGGFFCVELIWQWLNSGHYRRLDLMSGEIVHSAAHPQLPWSFSASDSLEMVEWFVPLWLILMAVRNFLNAGQMQRLLWILCVNGGLLGLLGIVQYLSGTSKILWLISIPNNPHFVATFGYSNHGGTYFSLLFALTLCFFFFWHPIRARRLYCYAAIGMVAILLLAGLCSLSRGAVLMLMALSVLALTIYLKPLFRELSAGNTINAVLIFTVSVGALAILLISLGDGAVLREFKSGAGAEDVSGYYVTRGFLIPPALAMFRDYPWCGVGGWGYRHLVKSYIPLSQWSLLSTGKANVHCDPVQFLCEFGMVGTSLMLASLICLWIPWVDNKLWRRQPVCALLGLGGVCLVSLQSLIDLPFRCPAVLWLWVIILAALPRVLLDRKSSVREKEEVTQ